MKNKNKKEIKKMISRKDAIIKTSKYAAITALATFVILCPKKSQAGSPTPPGW